MSTKKLESKNVQRKQTTPQKPPGLIRSDADQDAKWLKAAADNAGLVIGAADYLQHIAIDSIASFALDKANRGMQMNDQDVLEEIGNLLAAVVRLTNVANVLARSVQERAGSAVPS